MATEYTIYLVNNSAQTQQFWCFLARPDELAGDPTIFANSSTTLAVTPQSESINTFTIPVQYVVGAGASNNAVGLNIKVASTITKQTELQQTWKAGYATTVPPNLGPTLTQGPKASGPNTIVISSNAFDQSSNEANGWFSNMSYGVQTFQGFIGMTWSPAPQQTRTLTPKLQFYVATGSFGSNELASWTDVSNGTAPITVPGDFKYNKTTVTLTETGGWLVTPGGQTLQKSKYISLAARSSALDDLIQSHRMLSESHAGLIATARLLEGGEVGAAPAEDDVVGVTWDSDFAAAEALGGELSGTLTVGTAIATTFAFFMLASVRFKIKEVVLGRQIRFTYDGRVGAEFIKSLFIVGAKIFLYR
jgi:hypothetical protein